MGTKRMLKCLTVVGFITALAILQVHIRFTIRDLQIESLKLQEEKSYLIDKRNKLQSEVTELRRGDRIFEIAQNELGLVEYPANRIERLTVSEDISEKYQSVSLSAYSDDIRSASDQIAEPILSKLANAMGIHEVSQAREY